MDFDFSPAQYELRDEARRFLTKECTAEDVREFIDDPSGWSRTLWKQIADLGWMALPFPEENGGLGQGFLDLVLLLEELGAALAPVPFLSSVVLAGHAILQTLLRGRTRYAAIKVAVPDITDRMLSERLRSLEVEGLVLRTVVPETPVRVEYELTRKGRELQDALGEIAKWAEKWIPIHGEWAGDTGDERQPVHRPPRQVKHA